MSCYLRFGAQLKAILDARGLSASQLARSMGFKSKTSLFRILNDEVTFGAASSFWKEFQQTDPLQLTENETLLLEKSLAVSQQGEEAYSLNRSMDELLHTPAEEAADIPLACFGENAPRVNSFRQLMNIYRQSKMVRFVLINCAHPLLMRIIGENYNPQSMIIHHLLDLHGTLQDTVKNINAFLPLLPLPGYMPYASLQPIHSRQMFVLWQTPEGITETHFFAFTRQDELSLMASQDRQYPDFLKHTIQHPLLDLTKPLKDVIAPIGSTADYVAYTQRYYALEKDRPLYSIKPDVPINFIHPDLLVSAATDGFREMGLLNAMEQQALIEALYQVQLKRWQNFFEKRKVTHVIFSKEAMIRFARTGRQTDHFFAMRPYTMKEREKILSFLWEQSQSNPYFNIYFARDNNLIQDREISCYEGAGTVFLDANSSYASGHQEVIFNHAGFAQQFKNYFMNELIPRHILSPRETQHLWDYLISLCKS